MSSKLTKSRHLHESSLYLVPVDDDDNNIVVDDDDDDDDDDDCNDDDDDYNDDDDNIDDDCDCPQFPLWLRSTSSIVLISLVQ